MSYGMGSTLPQNPKKIAGHKVAQLQQYTPQQMQLFQDLFQHLSPDSYTARLAGGDQSLFNEMEAPALRQFSELQGNLASRFSERGTGGRHSSGFQNTMSAAGSNFAQELQSRRQELQRNALQDLMSMSSSLLGQRPYEQFLVEPNKKKNFFDQIMGGVLPIGGAIAGGTFGGPAGAAAGYQAGSGASQGFYA